MNTAQNTEKIPVLLFQIQAKDARDCLPSINPSVIEDKTSHGTKRPMGQNVLLYLPSFQKQILC